MNRFGREESMRAGQMAQDTLAHDGNSNNFNSNFMILYEIKSEQNRKIVVN